MKLFLFILVAVAMIGVGNIAIAALQIVMMCIGAVGTILFLCFACAIINCNDKQKAHDTYN